MRSYWVRMGLKFNDGVLLRSSCEDTGTKIHTGRTPYVKGGRDCRNTAANQGTPRFANSHQEKLGDVIEQVLP